MTAQPQAGVLSLLAVGTVHQVGRPGWDWACCEDKRFHPEGGWWEPWRAMGGVVPSGCCMDWARWPGRLEKNLVIATFSVSFFSYHSLHF